MLSRMSTPPNAADRLVDEALAVRGAASRRRRSPATSPPVAVRSSAAACSRRLAPARADRDPGALRREPRRGRAPEPVAAAGDHRHLALKPEIQHAAPFFAPGDAPVGAAALAMMRSSLSAGNPPPLQPFSGGAILTALFATAAFQT